ncbi:MAG TPA: MATE family efflux transporter [Firmicutes bacterium]|nr:MATE family efflux transporter [Bacillota bacterium]
MTIRNRFGTLDLPLLSTMFGFALPIMAMNILQLLFNAADMIVVGQFEGSRALAAVGATGSLINLIVNLFMGLSVGTAVVVARDYGARRVEGIRQSVHTSIAVSMVTGVIVAILGIVLSTPLLQMMGTPEDIIHLSTLYMKIYFVGIPASMVYNFGAAILRAVGDSKRPMYFLTVSGVVNVILNIVFVAVLHMGVAGVAWSTVISQYLTMALIMASLSKSESALRFSWKRLKIHKEKIKEIVVIGIPAGLQSLLFSISNVLIQSAVNSFGSVMVAASATAGNVEGLVSTTMNSYYNAAITYTGQSMGAEDYDKIDEIAKISTVFVFATWIVLGGLTILFGRPLLSLYTGDPEVIELGMVRLRIMMTVYFSAGIMSVFPGLTRAMGYSVLPMLSTLVGAWFFRILWLVTVFKWYPTIMVLFAAYPVTWTLAGIGQVLSFFYARGQIRKKAAARKKSSLGA